MSMDLSFLSDIKLSLKGRAFTHNMSGTHLYHAWTGMRNRCYSVINNRYNSYGARGITVCKSWRFDFLAFRTWSITNGYKPELTLDRENNNGDYTPDNCRWVTKSLQNSNKRKPKDNTSGYIGAYYLSCNGTYRAGISINKKAISLGAYSTSIEAGIARDIYIIKNKLPHTRNFPLKTIKQLIMMNLDFLKDITIEPVSKAKAKVEIVKLPGDDAHIRVFGSGKVFPSKAFANSAALEFVPKAVVLEGSKPEVIGNGFDIFSSEEWGMLQGKLPEPVLFCYVIPKAYAKVDLWANTKYDEDGTPKASVYTQGTSVFSKGQLLKIISEAYGIDWNKVDYVDMVIVVDQPVVHPLGIYDIPKIVSGGKKKGSITHIRRQNVTVCPLVIKHTEFLKIPRTSDKAPVLEQGAPFDEKVEVPASNIGTADPVTFGDSKEEPISAPKTQEVGEVSAENSSIPGSAIPPNPLFSGVPKTGEVDSGGDDKAVPEVTEDKTTPSAANWAAGLGAKVPT